MKNVTGDKRFEYNPSDILEQSISNVDRNIKCIS